MPIRMLRLFAPLILTLPLAAEPDEVLTWRASLHCPGGEIPFGLELERRGSKWTGVLINGTERIAVPRTRWDGRELILNIAHYDSRIVAKLQPNGELAGLWKKTSGPESVTRIPFRATRGLEGRFADSAASDGTAIQGRWEVDFQKSSDPAVAIFENLSDGTVQGTFLTTTGDYRYLAGSFSDDRLQLSCFDGAHAFLFDARRKPDGSLEGDFWSRDSWHETWTARRNDEVELPNAFEQTVRNERANIADFVLSDVDGRPQALADLVAGKVSLVVLFGSWCPNCHDLTSYLVELHERYAGRGLSITALAFELTGNFDRDAKQLKIYAERFGLPYPILLAGLADKNKASLAFPFVDRLRSYPTTLFFASDGTLDAIHTGFTGPATGQAYTDLRASFEARIEALLDREAPSPRGTWEELSRDTWRSSLDPELRWRFWIDSGAGLMAADYRAGEPAPTQGRPVVCRAESVWIDDRLWSYQPELGILQNPFDYGERLYPESESRTPIIPRRGYTRRNDVEAALDEDPLVRRESVVQTALKRPKGLEDLKFPEAMLILGRDEDPGVRMAALWAARLLQEPLESALVLPELKSPHPGLRREATRLLAAQHASSPEGRLALEALSREDPDPIVRSVAANALAN